MESGRELNNLIAKNIFGHQVVCTTWGNGKYKQYSLGEPDYYDEQGATTLANPVPNYSEDIESAWKLVEHFNNKGGAITYSSMKNGTRGHFVILSYVKSPINSMHHYVTVEGESMPHAVCLAALKTLEE